MKSLPLFVVAAASIILSVSAPAQSRTAFPLSVGPSIPIGTLRQTQKAGVGLSAGIARGSDDSPLGVRLDFSYDKLPGKLVQGVKQAEKRTTTGTLNLLFTFAGYTAKPYLFVGGGAAKMTAKGAADAVKTRFAYDFGLGFSLALAGKGVFVESRVNNVTQKDAKPLRYVPVSFGFMF